MAKRRSSAGATRRAAKVSPVKGKTVQWYIDQHDDWRGDVVRTLDEILSATVPKAESAIKWAQPVYECEGPFCFIKVAKQHVTIGFWRGTEISDPKGLLEGSGTKMRHVKIKSPDSLPTSDLKKMLRQAVKLNRENGDPTK